MEADKLPLWMQALAGIIALILAFSAMIKGLMTKLKPDDNTASTLSPDLRRLITAQERIADALELSNHNSLMQSRTIEILLRETIDTLASGSDPPPKPPRRPRRT